MKQSISTLAVTSMVGSRKARCGTARQQKLYPNLALRKKASAAVFALLLTASAHANFLYFDSPWDTISIAGQTVIGSTSTYEAAIYFPSSIGKVGRIFDEHQDSAEDKILSAGPITPGNPASTIEGYNYPIGPFLVATPISLSTWHHIAYVYDGSEQRIYLDGQLVGASGAEIGGVSNSGGTAALGAKLKVGSANVVEQGFSGYLDSLRISDIALYSGLSFAPPTGDLASQAGTVLLYHFNEPAGSSTIADLSGNGRTGTLGVGFIQEPAMGFGLVDAEMPELVSAISGGSSVPETGHGLWLAALALWAGMVSRGSREKNEFQKAEKQNR